MSSCSLNEADSLLSWNPTGTFSGLSHAPLLPVGLLCLLSRKSCPPFCHPRAASGVGSVSYSCCHINCVAQTTECYCFTDREDGSFRSRCCQDWFLLRAYSSLFPSSQQFSGNPWHSFAGRSITLVSAFTLTCSLRVCPCVSSSHFYVDIDQTGVEPTLRTSS